LKTAGIHPINSSGLYRTCLRFEDRWSDLKADVLQAYLGDLQDRNLLQRDLRQYFRPYRLHGSTIVAEKRQLSNVSLLEIF
jgi:CHAD domain-containing protein